VHQKISFFLGHVIAVFYGNKNISKAELCFMTARAMYAARRTSTDARVTTSLLFSITFIAVLYRAGDFTGRKDAVQDKK